MKLKIVAHVNGLKKYLFEWIDQYLLRVRWKYENIEYTSKIERERKKKEKKKVQIQSMKMIL